MYIYFGHSTKCDYEKELYQPIRETHLFKSQNLVFPHETSNELYDSAAFLKTADLMICEISEPSIGLGIEMGWASSMGVDLIYLVKAGVEISNSCLSLKTLKIIQYESSDDLIKQLDDFYLEFVT